MGVVNWSGYGGHVVVLRLSSQTGHVAIKILVSMVHSIIAVIDLVFNIGILIVLILIVIHFFRTIPPLVVGPAAGVHEKVSDGGWFEPELSSYCHLHLLGGSLGLLKNSLKCTTLEVRKNQSGLLGGRLLLYHLHNVFPLARVRG